MGFVGAKPEQRGERVVAFRLATHRRGYTKQDGTEVPSTSDWHSITVFDTRMCEFCMKYVDKGSLLLVEGELRYSNYTDANGVERQGIEIVASHISFPSLGNGKKKDDKGQESTEPQDSPAPVPSVSSEDLPF